jgi:serine/threonine protein kinase
MELRLTVVGGPDMGRTFPLPAGQKLLVGRGEASDTRINDPSVSRVHFEITVDGSAVFVVDKGSSSGTCIDGKQIETMEIRPGAVISAGDTKLRLDFITESHDTTVVRSPEQPTAVKPLRELIGTQFGPYLLESVIGRSNSGMVFKATDSEKNRVAAVKVLAPQFTSDDQQRQRFVRAMKTMLPIRDPHIIRLYNAGKTGQYCWAAMEFIEGENLTQLIERIGIDDMLDWKKVWRVAVDIGRALEAGYKAHIVHRNVTPTNIIRRDSDQTCLLGDFMLAKALEGTLAMDVTSPGQILGDVPYMAPERTRADVDVDTRADLYGLGATCYALLTGRPPISGQSITEMILNVRDEQPKRPKEFQLAVNDLFQDVVMKLLAKNPAERFENPTKLLKELIRIGNYNGLAVDA